MQPIPLMVVDSGVFIHLICINQEMLSSYKTYTTHYVTFLAALEVVLAHIPMGKFAPPVVGLDKEWLHEVAADVSYIFTCYINITTSNSDIFTSQDNSIAVMQYTLH